MMEWLRTKFHAHFAACLQKLSKNNYVVKFANLRFFFVSLSQINLIVSCYQCSIQRKWSEF